MTNPDKGSRPPVRSLGRRTLFERLRPSRAASHATSQPTPPATRRVAEAVAREFDRRRFLRRAADSIFVAMVWLALDARNAPVALASHTACNISLVGRYTCNPPCGNNCPSNRCSGELCTNGCSPSSCGGYSDSSHYCWCTDVDCGTQGYYICCDCCCPSLGTCTGGCPRAGCCLCKRFVYVGACFG